MANQIFRLISRLRPHVWRLAIAGICLLAASAIGLAFPQFVRKLLDAAFLGHSQSLLNKIAIGLLAIFALQAVLNTIQVYLLTSTSALVIAQLREDLFAKLVHLSPGFFTERRTGELTSRLSADTAVLHSVLSTNISEFTRQTLFLIGGLVLLTITHPTLTATTLAVVPVVVGAAIFFGRLLRKSSTGVQDKIAEATGTAEEAFSQIRTVQSFTGEREEIRKYGSHLSSVIAAAIKLSRFRGIFFGVLTFFGFGGVVAVLWQGGRLVLAGALTAGALVSFLLYALYVAGAVASLASLFGAYQEAVGAAKRVFELLDTESHVAEPVNPAPLKKPAQGALSINQVSFRYNDSLPYVLNSVSLDIAPGEVVALVGPSGSGKTTIASLIPRFWDVTSGRITFDGIDIRELSLHDLRCSIGVVPQEPTLFSGTVSENIAYARSGPGETITEEDIRAAASAAHALEFIERLPEGFDTRVGERGVKLSGGQRQRLAIARVFLKNPALVILDEATSSLDNESERLVEEAMEDLLRNRSTLIIAHRLSTVQRADRVVVIDGGEIVEEGKHAELIAAQGIYSRLYHGQFRAGAIGKLTA